MVETRVYATWCAVPAGGHSAAVERKWYKLELWCAVPAGGHGASLVQKLCKLEFTRYGTLCPLVGTARAWGKSGVNSNLRMTASTGAMRKCAVLMKQYR